jgi:formate hydrogenlyase subunit 6/NADH:ubiquinone oxidoreductase subunit I
MAQQPSILGRCLFCQECVVACPEGAIQYTKIIAFPRAHARI